MLHVDVERLRGVAASVTEVSLAVGKAQETRQHNLAAGGAAEGWATAAAVATACAAWGAFVSRLARSIEKLASDIRTAADSYERADADAAQAVRHGGRLVV